VFLSFEFGNLYFLLLLLLAPLIAYQYYFRKPLTRIRFSTIKNLKNIPKSKATLLRNLIPLLRIGAFMLLVVALARPQFGRKSVEVISEGVDIIVAIDTSGSMKALDFIFDGDRQTRLYVVKKVVADFISKRQADRLGMVVFGEQAFTQCPLTLDHGVVLSFLKEVEIGSAGEGGTAIGSALATSVARLKDIKAKSKIVILLTDGRNNAGKIDPETSAELAAKYNIKVYTIGAGSRGKAPFLVNTPFGRNLMYQQVDIDEDLLLKIANMTGGKYYRATATEELSKIYEEIDRLEKTEIKMKEHVEYNELYMPFVIAALILLLFELVLLNTRFRTLP